VEPSTFALPILTPRQSGGIELIIKRIQNTQSTLGLDNITIEVWFQNEC
jgi:hypothetical protein